MNCNIDWKKSKMGRNQGCKHGLIKGNREEKKVDKFEHDLAASGIVFFPPQIESYSFPNVKI